MYANESIVHFNIAASLQKDNEMFARGAPLRFHSTDKQAAEAFVFHCVQGVGQIVSCDVQACVAFSALPRSFLSLTC